MITFNNVLVMLKKQGHSQKELADFLGVPKSRITDWKSGRVNSYTKYLPQIAEFLNISVDALLGKEETKKEPATESDRLLEEAIKIMRSLDPEDQKQAYKYLEFLHKSEDNS